MILKNYWGRAAFILAFSVIAVGVFGITAPFVYAAVSTSVSDYSQCSNDLGEGYAGADDGCHWINGAINAQNSIIYEGDGTVQRLHLKNLTDGNHTVTLEYATTKGGKHAYDFLVRDIFSEIYVDASDFCESLSAFASCVTLAPNVSPTIPTDSNTGGFDAAIDAASRVITIRNGTIPSFISGPTLVSGSYAGDSSTEISFNVLVDTDTCVNMDVVQGIETCPVLITLAGHVSTQDDWGAGMSAVNINGEPYHIKVVEIDGSSIGNRDNQMAAGAIVVPQGTISGVKFNDVNGNGVNDAEPPLQNWQITLNPGNVQVNTDVGGLYTFANLADGVYTICETQQGGWTQTFPQTDPGSCAGGNGYSVTISNGTNNPSGSLDFGNTQSATLTLVKQVTNNNGGAALATAWTLTATGPTSPISGTTGSGAVTSVPVQAGSYALSESNGPAGYTASDWVCTGTGTQTGANIALDGGESAICTITNDDIAPQLTVIKHVINDNGGSAVAGEFTMNVTATNPSDASFSGAEAPGTTITLNAGAYSVDESAFAGYTKSLGADCSGTIAVGESKTCTITNDDQQATITVVKVVTNDNGGTAQPNDFNLTLEGNAVTSGVAVPVNPGAYTADETLLTGYTFTGFSGDCDQNGDVTVALGESKTCALTNNDIAPSLTLVKQVTNNNGGTAAVTDWTLSANGPTPISGAGGVTSDATFDAGAYALSESTGPAGYTASAWVCVGGTQNGSNITVALAQSATCTITNDDQSGTLTIVKNTVGGDATFGFTVTGPTASTPNILTVGNTGTTGAVAVNAGNYSVSESTIPAGWDFTTAICTSGTPAGFTVVNGGNVTCTFTNTQRGHIIIRKNAINDSDQAFTFNNNFGNGNPATFQLVDDSTPGLPSYDAEVVAGEYAVTEDVVAGWQFEGATCDASETIESINVAAGETVTCTFTNEKLAKITLVKNTVGGDDTFDFDATGAGIPADIDLATVGGTASQVFTDLDPDNTYSFAENLPAGWALASAVCDNGDLVANITPNAGEEITCTFTNNKPSAQIDLTPLTAVNAIGDDHVITATVQVHNGNGSYGAAVDGTVVTFSIVNSNGATAAFVGGNTCATTAGACAATINSPTVGNVAIHASASPIVLGVAVAVETDGLGDNSADAAKQYVNARIRITPDAATNEVNDDHNFIVTVEQNTGSGFVAVPMGTIANAIVSPATSLDVSDCTNGVDALGQCTVTINSSVAGVFTITARSTVSVNGVEFKLQTNGNGENSDPAVKTYVDAKISIDPQSAVNEVGDAHVLTATVMENDGLGFDPAVGETVTFTVTSGDATFVGGVNTCVTNGSGACSVSIESSTVGDNTIKAVSDVGIASLILHRETNGTQGSSASAVKKYVDGYITIGETATNNIGDAHIFTVTITQVAGSATPATEASVTPSVLPAPDSFSSTCDALVPFVGNVATCTITINNNTPGVFDATASATFTVGGVVLNRTTDGLGQNSDKAVKTYVAGSLEITKSVVGLANVVNGSTVGDTFTVTVTGPSYPLGHNIVFTLTDGVLSPTSVTLQNLIPGDYTITEADAGTEWTETVPANAVAVVANETAEATVTNTYVPGALEVSKTVQLNGYLFPLTVDGQFTIQVTGPSYPAPHDVVITVVDGVPTNSPQTLQNLIPGAYTVTEVGANEVAWTVSGNGNVNVTSGQTAQKAITNSLKIPSTNITITPNVFETEPGQNVVLTITDTNDGQAPIASPSVELLANNVLTIPQPTYVSGDTNLNTIMDIGETWTWTAAIMINVNTVFTVNGMGTDPLGNPVNGPTYASETDSVTVRVIGTTRTIGFWQTHTNFTSYVFTLASMQQYVGIAPSKGVITNVLAAGQSQLFGGFYAPIAKKTTGQKRTPIDQARIQMLQQLLGAKLNCAAFGCSQATMTLIANADAAYAAGANKGTIIALAGQLDAFNNSGDDNAIPAELPATGKATPKTSQSLADKAFWDLP